MVGIESIINDALGIQGIPYPNKQLTTLDNIIDNHPARPIIEISVNVENGKGNKYDLLVSSVIYSAMLDSTWWVYGYINETMTGNPEDIQVLTFRYFQGRGMISPLRLWGCQFLDCEVLGKGQILDKIPYIKNITRYQWLI